MEVLELTVLKNTPGNKDRERKQSKSEYLSFFKVVCQIIIMILLKLVYRTLPTRNDNLSFNAIIYTQG